MLIAALGQHLEIASKEEAIRLSAIDRDFWNVISIRGVDEAPADLPRARRVHFACFDDVEDSSTRIGFHAATADDLARILQFADSVAQGPLLIHCRAGLSRGPAVALAWICRQVAAQEDFANQAVEILLGIRPKAVPNRLVLTLGLGRFLPKSEAAVLAARLADHPGLLANRQGSP